MLFHPSVVQYKNSSFTSASMSHLFPLVFSIYLYSPLCSFLFSTSLLPLCHLFPPCIFYLSLFSSLFIPLLLFLTSSMSPLSPLSFLYISILLTIHSSFLFKLSMPIKSPSILSLLISSPWTSSFSQILLSLLIPYISGTSSLFFFLSLLLFSYKIILLKPLFLTSFFI
jgi:hypothetical protein